MPNQLPIGERIKQHRKAERLTAKAFAEKYGLDVSNLYKWEKGVKPSDIDDYKKLESILNGSNIEIKKPSINNWAGEIEERLIRLESESQVYRETVSALVAASTGKQIAVVSAELQEAVLMVSKSALNELRKKNA